MTRARSLSRLANTNAFTVDASQRVGIGSTLPDVRLDVNGDMNVTGTLTYEDVTNVETAGITTTGGLVVTGLGATIGGITTFFGDINFGAAGVGGTVTTLGHAEFVGVVTASSFSGDGSGLTGVASTDNINTSTLAQFTGPVGIADSIFHIGDTNCRIQFPSNDTFTVTTAADERFRVTSTGRQQSHAAYATVGINTFASWARHGGAIRAEIGYNAVVTDYIYFGTGTDHPVSLRVNNTDAVYIKNDGKVGIGTTVPAHLLHLHAGAASQILLERSGSNPSKSFIKNEGELLEFSQNTDGIIFKTGGTPSERVRITSAGRVGVGSDSPNSILDAYAGDGISISNNGDTFLQSRTLNDTGTNYLEFKDSGGGSGAISYHHNGNSLRFKVNGSERIRIADSGEIGIAGANYGTSGQVLTSKGSGASVAWEDASGGGGITTQVGNASGIVTSMFLNDATDHKVTATGICTITTTQSGTEGQSHTIRIVNSGIATVGFSTYFLFPSGSAPVLPTADGAVSLISFTVHDSVGAGCTQLLAGASVNFS